VHQLFTSNLVTRSSSAEHHAADVDRSIADVEHTRVRIGADRETFDPAECMFVTANRMTGVFFSAQFFLSVNTITHEPLDLA